MKALKIILWICAFCFLLEIIVVPLPWETIAAFFTWMGAEPLGPAPFAEFGFRLSMAMFGMIGIFFVFLARDPLKYGAMLPLAACGLLCYGIFWIIGGIGYKLPTPAYICDAVFGIVAGVLILVFQRAARRPVAGTMEEEPVSGTE